ncbi:transcriptional regulator, partial [Carnobacterium divergens]
MIILGKKIKKIRKQQKLTQKELSQGICTQVTISK